MDAVLLFSLKCFDLVCRTLADLAGVPDVEEGVDGMSLASLLRESLKIKEFALMYVKGSPEKSTQMMILTKPAAFGQHARCLRNVSDGYCRL